MTYVPWAFASPEQMLAQLDWQPLFEDQGLPLAIMGLFVVFAALTLLRIFIGTLPRIIAVLDLWFPAGAEATPAASVAPVQNVVEGLPEEIAVVIATAVAVTLRVPHRIVHTRELSPEDLSWSLEGRLQQHASHRIHPRDSR